MIFTVKDYQDISVSLSETTWNDKILHPVFGHPEVSPYQKDIPKTIMQPDSIFASVRDPRSRLYFRKLTSKSFSGYYLLVVVKYVHKERETVGYVSTVFITDHLSRKGKRLV